MTSLTNNPVLQKKAGAIERQLRNLDRQERQAIINQMLREYQGLRPGPTKTNLGQLADLTLTLRNHIEANEDYTNQRPKPTHRRKAAAPSPLSRLVQAPLAIIAITWATLWGIGEALHLTLHERAWSALALAGLLFCCHFFKPRP